MLEQNTIPGFIKIICDKCGHSEKSTLQDYNEDFFESGWALCPNAKKYIHRCRDCQTSKEKKAHDFVLANFYLHK